MRSDKKTEGSRSTVVGVFRTHEEAAQAVVELKQAGFPADQISLVGKDPGGKVKTEGTNVAAGAATGVVVGAGAAALVSLGMSFGVIPVIGPILAIGPLAAALISAAGGAAAGGLVGALVGLGLPEHEAKYYESEVQSGRYLVTVNAGQRYDAAWSILHRLGAYNHQSATESTGEQTMKLHEERLHATKEPVKTGEVRVHKEVVTEHKKLDVPVTKEEVVIERRPVSGHTTSSADIRSGEEIRIPVREEQVRVTKDTAVNEEVTVGKRKVQETEQVGGTVRKEKVRVEKEGDVDVRDKGGTAKSDKDR